MGILFALGVAGWFVVVTPGAYIVWHAVVWFTRNQ